MPVGSAGYAKETVEDCAAAMLKSQVKAKKPAVDSCSGNILNASKVNASAMSD